MVKTIKPIPLMPFHTVARDSVVCAVCGTGNICDGTMCGRCETHAEYRFERADQTGFLVATRDGTPAGNVMWNYKATPPDPRAEVQVRILLRHFERNHLDCTSDTQMTPVTAWATIPSLKGREGPHPIREIWASIIGDRTGLDEIEMTGQTIPDKHERRRFEPAHFTVESRVRRFDHVLVIDDTWVSGGHSQSAAAALRAAGAGIVSVLTVARWFQWDFPGGFSFPERKAAREAWAAEHLVPYSPERCPWTPDGVCPSVPSRWWD